MPDEPLSLPYQGPRNNNYFTAKLFLQLQCRFSSVCTKSFILKAIWDSSILAPSILNLFHIWNLFN